MGYDVRFYTGEYHDRNAEASHDKCVLKVDGHLNAAGKTPSYSLVEYNTSEGTRCHSFAKALANACVNPVGATQSHTRALAPGDRGHVCTDGFNGDGVVWEPGFASNPKQARIYMTAAGKEALAQALAATIRKHYPDGSRIAFSIGHKGKPSAPNDRGACLAGTHGKVCEAHIMEPVLKRAAELLEDPKSPPPAKKPQAPVEAPDHHDPKKMPTLHLGSHGGMVPFLQRLLNHVLPGHDIHVDGDFGPKTEAAVIHFQKLNHLSPDGVVGPKTWGKLL